VAVDVKNTGEAEGSKTVKLKIEGEIADKETVTLSSGKSTTVEFPISKEKEGTYEVTVGEMSKSFEVVSEEAGEGQKPEGGLPVIPIGIGIAVIVIIAVILLYRWR
ncbi:hypothetical protein AKJ64_05175, partial [candidate division MSBL1 archaeon SCGC-AAA259E17]